MITTPRGNNGSHSRRPRLTTRQRLRPGALLRALLPLAVLSLTFFPLTGCRDAPSAAAVRYEIERQIPGLRLERESHIRLGRFTMGLAKKIVRLAGDEDEDDMRLISHIRRVDIATYRVVRRPTGPLMVPTDIETRLAERGWETTVRMSEDDEQTWILFRTDENDAIRGLYVVDLDPYELTVVSLDGRLDRLIAEALADDPDGLSEILGT